MPAASARARQDKRRANPALPRILKTAFLGALPTGFPWVSKNPPRPPRLRVKMLSPKSRSSR
jgi:hypothetical protein